MPFPSTSILRQWFIIPRPRLSFLFPTLLSTIESARTFSSNFSKAGRSTKQTKDKPHTADEKYKEREKKRQAQERNMPTALGKGEMLTRHQAISLMTEDLSLSKPNKIREPLRRTIKSIEEKIIDLEERLKLEHMYSPIEDSEDILAFKLSTKVDRNTSRAKWRARKKAARLLKQIERGKEWPEGTSPDVAKRMITIQTEKMQAERKKDIQDLESSLAEFRGYLQRYKEQFTGEDAQNLESKDDFDVLQLDDTRRTSELIEPIALRLANEPESSNNRKLPADRASGVVGLPQKDDGLDSHLNKAQARVRHTNGNPSNVSVFGKAHEPKPPPPSWPAPSQLQAELAPLRIEDLQSPEPVERMRNIDSHLTINYDSPVPELQSQLYQLQNRLQNAYPKIDTLPYEVWASKNRNVLKTWLKILVNKWEKRFDRVTMPVIDDLVKATLDQMVRDHELEFDAAERMTRRFHEVFESKRRIDIDGELDMDELDAEMGWLRDDNNVIYISPRTNSASTPIQNEADSYENKPPKHSKSKPTSQTHSLAWGKSPRSQSKTAGTVRDFRGMRGFSTLRKQYSSTEPTESTITEEEKDELVRKYRSSEHGKFEPRKPESRKPTPEATSLPHLTSTGAAHMVSVSQKRSTLRTAIAVGRVVFSNPEPLSLIQSNSNKKGDVLATARIAGIMAAKRCPELIPLAHPINLTHVSVVLRPVHPSLPDNSFIGLQAPSLDPGWIEVQAKVECKGETGVEMEALTAIMGAALTVVDMCKAVDKGMTVEKVRVVFKEGGKSGTWRERGWREIEEV
ncbi:MoaC-domain-containing protein [Lojkania enalia]|uniref:cyclic pyranopterin monophosphate synthase n=1 Tax=Lojkania enalia TaxID=147567 RepID=A0A9P4N7D5_9PLEO|nr:MoaC-domain-containing protein [Didymosphaeria enalia]